ncbi:unnamed protein product [Closterium sp. NIES-54]
MSGSLPAPEAPAEPAADAGKEVRTQNCATHVAYKRWMARDAAPKLGVRAHLSLDRKNNFRQVPSALALYTAVVRRYSPPPPPPPPPPATLGCLELHLTFPASNEGVCSGAGESGEGGQQQLECSCVATCAPTSTGAVPAEALLFGPVTLADPTSRLVHAHPSPVLSCLVVPSDSSGSTEGGDPAAANTTTYFGGPDVVWGSGSRGVGSGGAGSEGAVSGGADFGSARSPLVGGLGGTGAGGAGTGARGVPRTGGPGVCAGGAGSGGASQSLLRRPIFLEQPSSSLPESALHPLPRLSTASAKPTATASAPLLFPPLDSPLSAPAPYSPSPVSLAERQVPVSCAASPATSRVARELVVLPLPPPSSLPAASGLATLRPGDPTLRIGGLLGGCCATWSD